MARRLEIRTLFVAALAAGLLAAYATRLALPPIPGPAKACWSALQAVDGCADGVWTILYENVTVGVPLSEDCCNALEGLGEECWRVLKAPSQGDESPIARPFAVCTAEGYPGPPL